MGVVKYRTGIRRALFSMACILKSERAHALGPLMCALIRVRDRFEE